jgi:hypothetical protein
MALVCATTFAMAVVIGGVSFWYGLRLQWSAAPDIPRDAPMQNGFVVIDRAEIGGVLIEYGGVSFRHDRYTPDTPAQTPLRLHTGFRSYAAKGYPRFHPFPPFRRDLFGKLGFNWVSIADQTPGSGLHREVHITFPLWLPLIMLAVPMHMWHRTRRLAKLQAARQAAGLCTGCGYDLRVPSDRCPECGLRTTDNSNGVGVVAAGVRR